mmetsp:Transcript_33231/g.53350  ORF Transcript_33231/g.53350 Transcript_33231/m.53350 type:complete len:90 (-) Transcript_33231:94-363(-)
MPKRMEKLIAATIARFWATATTILLPIWPAAKALAPALKHSSPSVHEQQRRHSCTASMLQKANFNGWQSVRKLAQHLSAIFAAGDRPAK